MLHIVNTCDAIAEMLDRESSPTAETLDKLGGLLAGESAYMVSILPKIAEAVASLDDITPGKDTGIFHVGNRVLSAPTCLSEPTKSATIRLQILRSTGNAEYETDYFARDGVAFSGPSKLRENSMIRMRIETAKGAIDAIGVVARCSTEGTRHRMEAKLFAADQNTERAWLSFYSSLA